MRRLLVVDAEHHRLQRRVPRLDQVTGTGGRVRRECGRAARHERVAAGAEPAGQRRDVEQHPVADLRAPDEGRVTPARGPCRRPSRCRPGASSSTVTSAAPGHVAPSDTTTPARHVITRPRYRPLRWCSMAAQIAPAERLLNLVIALVNTAGPDDEGAGAHQRRRVPGGAVRRRLRADVRARQGHAARPRHPDPHRDGRRARRRHRLPGGPGRVRAPAARPDRRRARRARDGRPGVAGPGGPRRHDAARSPSCGPSATRPSRPTWWPGSRRGCGPAVARSGRWSTPCRRARPSGSPTARPPRARSASARSSRGSCSRAAAAGCWSGRDRDRGASRSFRLSRIEGSRPDGRRAGLVRGTVRATELADALQTWASGPERVATLAILPERASAPRARAVPAPPDEPDWSRPTRLARRHRDLVHVPFRAEWELAEELVGYGDAVVVLAPAGLRRVGAAPAAHRRDARPGGGYRWLSGRATGSCGCSG